MMLAHSMELNLLLWPWMTNVLVTTMLSIRLLCPTTIKESISASAHYCPFDAYPKKLLCPLR